MNEEINVDVESLNPFTRFIYTIGELPSSYLMSMTYEEQLIWLCNYLAETVIPTVNNNGQAVSELQNLYIQLQNYVNHYFDNLDIQNEINTKLDEMASDGTLLNLIKGYIDPIYQAYENEINNAINIIDNKVNAVIDNNPIPVSSTSDMTDETKIYINTTDGYWYYYNGTAWTQGGVYQASQLGEKQITNYNIKDKNVLLEKIFWKNNLLDVADSVLYNKKFLGYNTSTYVPSDPVDSDSTIVAYFNDISTLPDTISYVVTNTTSNTSCYAYIQSGTSTRFNVAGSAADGTNVSSGSYTKANNILTLNIRKLKATYSKMAITLDKNYPYVYEGVYTPTKTEVEYHQNIQGSNIKGYVTTDKIALNKENLINDTSISFINNARTIGYDSDTRTLSTQADLNYNIINIDLSTLNNSYTGIRVKFPFTIATAPNTNLIVGYDTGNYAANLNISNIINGNYVENGYLNVNKVIEYFSFIDITNVAITVENVNTDLLIYNLIDKNNNPNNLFGADFDILLPNKLKGVSNKKLLLFHNNIVRNCNTDKTQEIRLSNADKNLPDVSIIERTTQNFNSTYQLYSSDTNIPTLNKTISIDIVPSNAGNGTNKKILLIGDSFTARGVYPKHIYDLFQDDVMDVTFLGTQGNDNYKTEGYSGWRAYTFVNCASGSDDVQTLSGTNPFYNPSTQTFDFSYYMENHNYADVDYVFINLGTNDITRGNHESDSDILDYYDTMINSIQSFNSSIKIGVWLPPLRGINNNYGSLQSKNNAMRMTKLLIDNYSNQENNGIYLIPVYTQIDPNRDYTMESYTVDSNYTTNVITDTIHCANSGMNKIGDVIYYWIKYFASIE